MTGFSISWLDLRESADHAARDKPLARAALQFLDKPHGALLVDLGAGTGSTLRALSALAPAGGTYIVWRLVDHDGALLDEALRRHGTHCVIEDHQCDLRHVAELPLGGATLVSASALFDLASPDFASALLARLQGQGTALYAALNYDGRTQWTPSHPLDAAVLDAFNRDQRTDKGLGSGPALGPDACAWLQSHCEALGYAVQTADSAWQLGPQDAALVRELIVGMARAVAVKYDLDADALHDWKTFRLAHADAGTCLVGHLDLLAVPG
jgi:SAM-dependent methyltransferase